jgi:phospholipase/carboxylesterase
MITYTETSSSTHIELTPSIPACGSLIWLHGLGADGNDFISLPQELQLPDHLVLRFIFPHAPLSPITIHNGYVMRAWFDIYSKEIDRKIDQAGVQASVALVEKFIEQEKKRNLPTEKIFLGGFSQGAVIALTAGLQHSETLGGIIALSGYLPHADLASTIHQANQSIPIFIAHGTEDSVVAFALGLSAVDALKTQNLPVSWHSYPMAHTVCMEEMSDISEWLSTQMR